MIRCFFVFSLLACLLLVSEASASIVTVLGMNADDDVSSMVPQLEGDLGGSGANGTSGFAITAAPNDAAVGSTFADYSVTGVDLDDDGVFSESFTFRITFSSRDDVNFTNSLEVLGLGNNEIIDLNEAITMTGTVLSDSSATHDVTFDGFSAFDFISMQNTVVDISGTNYTLNSASEQTLSQLELEAVMNFSNPTGFNSGTLEDWSVQFSTMPTAIPEPTTLIMFGSTVCGLLLRRRRLK